jgi:hypothetical protein
LPARWRAPVRGPHPIGIWVGAFKRRFCAS